jgi:lipoprotein-anchoring transpeptidase ErfK/SrfK
MALSRRSLAVFLLPLAVLVASCGGDSDESPLAQPTGVATRLPALVITRPPNTPTPTPQPTITPVPSPTPTATPPALAANEAIVIGGEVRTRAQASTSSEQVGTLPDKSKVQIAQRVQGENWLVGAQTWSMVVPPWAREWFKLSDGSFVYGAFVFILQPGEVSPVAPAPSGVEKWIDVDIARQTARAMVGNQAVFTAPISSGAPPFDTPKGKFAVEPDGRIAVERMTATQAGYDAAQAQYNVERVLFTQYFDQRGNAIHLNYWRPHSVFGRQATSHGCIGLELHEAQYFWLFAQPGTRVEIH